MSKGFLIFAQNNSDMDYCKIAAFCARRLRQFSDLPISIVTDSADWLKTSQPDAEELFDKIISHYSNNEQYRRYYDGSMHSKKLSWKNFSRVEAYELTPYKQTIVIDSDYIVASNKLDSFFDQEADIAMFKDSFDLAQWRDTKPFKFINNQSVPFYWATVLYFKKNKYSEAFFDLVKHIKNNWKYYKLLYEIESKVYRNDFAFSIAAHIMNGNVDFNISTLPGKKFYTLDRDVLLAVEENKFKFLVEKEKYFGEYILAKTQGVDVHVMNKYSLSRIIDAN